MPKKPSDRVETVRFELQEKERQIAESYLLTWQFAKMAEAIDKIASFENLYVIATALELITGKELIPGTPNDVVELADSIKEGATSFPLYGINEEQGGKTVRTGETGTAYESLWSYVQAQGGVTGSIETGAETLGIPGFNTLFNAWWGLRG
jgi:hypothetical protein